MCGTVVFRFVPCHAVSPPHIFQSYRFFTVFCLDSESICEFRLRKQTLATTMTSTEDDVEDVDDGTIWRGSASQKKRRTSANRTNVHFHVRRWRYVILFFVLLFSVLTHTHTHTLSLTSICIFFRFGIFFSSDLSALCRAMENTKHFIESCAFFVISVSLCFTSLYSLAVHVYQQNVILFFFRWFGGVSSCISSRPRR